MSQEHDISKLTSIDDNGDRVYIIPAEVRGLFRKHRNWTQFILLSFFLAMPWIEISGRQSILLDIPDRKFILFGVIFKAHETPLLFFLLAIGTLGLALVTSVWGRIWCGWACPQTVFIDAVYRRIEIAVEGNYIERRKLKVAPLSFVKIYKKSLKWFLFFIVSSLIAHSFMAYFTGSKELLNMMQGNPSENWNYFLLVSFFTALVLFDFAWFREQFCVIMCPYGRIQSVLLEPSSLAVAYDQQRGEPRRSALNKGSQAGDCVSCNRCVEVCPTGIDIRNGLQMECIACTACIDACDEIMQKVNKPKGLIKYTTLDGSPFRFTQFKTLAYSFLILVAMSGLIYSLSTRAAVNIALLRAIDTPYTVNTEADGTQFVLNHFRLHLTSQANEDGSYLVVLPEKEKLKGIQLVIAQNPLYLKKDSSETWHIFVKIPLAKYKEYPHELIKIVIQKQNSDVSFERELTLLGPQQ